MNSIVQNLNYLAFATTGSGFASFAKNGMKRVKIEKKVENRQKIIHNE